MNSRRGVQNYDVGPETEYLPFLDSFGEGGLKSHTRSVRSSWRLIREWGFGHTRRTSMHLYGHWLEWLLCLAHIKNTVFLSNSKRILGKSGSTL